MRFYICLVGAIGLALVTWWIGMRAVVLTIF